MSVEKDRAAYRARRPLLLPWALSGTFSGGCSGAVVIPSLAESAHLPATLSSLAKNPAEFLQRFFVLVVVNHREDADPSDKRDSNATLAMLPGLAEKLPLQLAWVDACSPGLELPLRGGGVGMARKIGFDLALSSLHQSTSSPLLIALDADTLVEPNYLPTIEEHFSTATAGGAIIPFRHQEANDPQGQRLIDRYELFLRSYVLGLELARSPYAFQTVGSAMACTARAYIRADGMNCRRAGEDFYFLQQLKKTAGIAEIRGTTVHPSPRSSHRVPFGTGRSVAKGLAEDETTISFYHPECFRILSRWLEAAAGSSGLGGEGILKIAGEISPHLAIFLQQEGCQQAWDRISAVKKDAASFLAAFHEWFDALRTMKLVHHLSAVAYPRIEPEEAVPPLLAEAGLQPVRGVREQLELLRRCSSGLPT